MATISFDVMCAPYETGFRSQAKLTSWQFFAKLPSTHEYTCTYIYNIHIYMCLYIIYVYIDICINICESEMPGGEFYWVQMNATSQMTARDNKSEMKALFLFCDKI